MVLARTILAHYTPPVPSPVPSLNVPSLAPSPTKDINAIVQAVVQSILAANAASVAANPPAPSPTPTLSQPATGHQPSPSDNFFLKAWDGNRNSFPVFQGRIRAWFESPSFKGVTTFTETLLQTKHRSSFLRLSLITGLLPDKIMAIFLHNPVYERDRFKMWGRILEQYDPQGKDALFESVYALYTLEQAADELISAYMSRARRLFSGLHGVTVSTMANFSSS